MRLFSRLFVFASTLFILLYGVLPGLFKIEGDFVASFAAGTGFLRGINPTEFYRFPLFQQLIDLTGYSGKMIPFAVAAPSSFMSSAALALLPIYIARIALTAFSIAAFVIAVHVTSRLSGASNKMTYSVFLSSSYALASVFQSGQPTILLMSILLLAFYAYAIGKGALCGALIGIVFPFNPFLGIPAVMLLLSAKWRSFAYFALATAGILAITYVSVGESAFMYYLQPCASLIYERKSA